MNRMASTTATNAPDPERCVCNESVRAHAGREARYLRARQLACEIEQLLTEEPGDSHRYGARLASGLARSLSDALDALSSAASASSRAPHD